MKTFNLSQGKPAPIANCTDLPDEIQIVMSQERAVQLLSQLANRLLCAMDGKEDVKLRIRGTFT